MSRLVVPRIFLAVAIIFATSIAVIANESTTDRAEDKLFERLQSATPGQSRLIEKQIVKLWSESGSASMNRLLERGRQAILAKNYDAAIEHLTALTNLAPEFAEGWNARATAYFYMGEYDLSVDDIGIVLELNERHFGALSGLAMIMEQFGEDSSALNVYRDIEAIYPNRVGLKQAIDRLKKKVDAKSL